MSTLAEIKTAIARLDSRDRALLAAEFLAFQDLLRKIRSFKQRSSEGWPT